MKTTTTTSSPTWSSVHALGPLVDGVVTPEHRLTLLMGMHPSPRSSAEEPLRGNLARTYSRRFLLTYKYNLLWRDFFDECRAYAGFVRRLLSWFHNLRVLHAYEYKHYM